MLKPSDEIQSRELLLNVVSRHITLELNKTDVDVGIQRKRDAVTIWSIQKKNLPQ